MLNKKPSNRWTNPVSQCTVYLEVARHNITQGVKEKWILWNYLAISTLQVLVTLVFSYKILILTHFVTGMIYWSADQWIKSESSMILHLLQLAVGFWLHSPFCVDITFSSTTLMSVGQFSNYRMLADLALRSLQRWFMSSSLCWRNTASSELPRALTIFDLFPSTLL